ncbi:hypothetical protein HPB48_016039 [Haemaphysalis longicornis]|uniref:Uncharacterized protein n=1 Tax=Haemaphysalis longicornis TaxID=44386 RepID=A0A9J6GV38_HAELO|nr:hypothetical protein HPB48_016039 [Haemaphysalis longicornis]
MLCNFQHCYITKANMCTLRRYGAEALEVVHSYPGLIKGLSEELCVPMSAAVEMVKRALWGIEGLDDFLGLAGVVRERVVCRQRDDRRLQLANLGCDCWNAVRRHLLISDIVDDSRIPSQV